MDSIGDGWVALSVYQMDFLPEKNIYLTSSSRQVDKYSCRTGALILLRNALLSLRYHNATGSFHSFLTQNAELEEGTSKIKALPPDWDYTEQIGNPLLKNREVSDIRRRFSKKQKSPRSALDHRDSHTRERTFTYVVRQYKGKLEIDPELQPPPGITFHNYEKGWSLGFKAAYSVNTYLLEKGRKMAEKAGA